MTLAVKICGVATPEIVATVASSGTEYIGFVHHARSPRHLSIETMAALRAHVPPSLKTVCVVVDAEDGLLQALARAVRPDFFQLHGHESPQRVTAIKRLTATPVIKAIGVSDQHDIAGAADYEECSNMLLFDAKPQLRDELPGGRGTAFEWSLMKNNWHNLPSFLSGGLNAGNLAEAVATSGAKLVDVSSGVETAPGVKSVQKILEFMEAAGSIHA